MLGTAGSESRRPNEPAASSSALLQGQGSNMTMVQETKSADGKREEHAVKQDCGYCIQSYSSHACNSMQVNTPSHALMCMCMQHQTTTLAFFPFSHAINHAFCRHGAYQFCRQYNNHVLNCCVDTTLEGRTLHIAICPCYSVTAARVMLGLCQTGPQHCMPRSLLQTPATSLHAAARG